MGYLKVTYLIFKLVFREIFRNRTYGFIIIFSLLLTACSLFFVNFTFLEQEKFLKDVGLASITIFSLVLGIILGAMSIQNDFESKNIYIIISNPITVSQYLLGKFLGAAFLIGLAIIAMGFVLYFNLIIQKLSFILIQPNIGFESFEVIGISIQEGFCSNLELLKVFFMIFLQSIVMYVISLFLSSFTTVPIAVISSIIVFILSYFTNFIVQISFFYNTLFGYFLKILFIWIPNFENFSIADAVVLGQHVSSRYLGWLINYSLIFLIIYLLLAYKRISSKISNF